MIALLVVTNGRRDCISATIPSAEANLAGPITQRVIFDDSGDDGYRDWLAEEFPEFLLLRHPAGPQGFGGAIRTAWQFLGATDARFVFHLEDDFTFERPVDLAAMASVLDACPRVVQVALRRQAWSAAEVAAGGVVEQHPDDYRDAVLGAHPVLLHRRFFTTNPSLYRRDLCQRGWPAGRHSEGRFALDLFTEDPERVAAFWGARTDAPWVHHIGHKRVGSGY